MNYMVLDTETNGLPKYHLPADHPDQPRLASLAVILLDNELAIESEKLFFIKPDGWGMTEKATAVNGLTDVHLYQDGVPVVDVLGPFHDAIDAGRVVVGFNSRMDLKILRGESRRAGLDDRFEKTLSIDCMSACTPIVGLKRKNGAPKWPTLQEAFEYFYKAPIYVNYHNALNDARATFAIFRELKKLDALPEPKVYYARGKEAQ